MMGSHFRSCVDFSVEYRRRLCSIIRLYLMEDTTASPVDQCRESPQKQEEASRTGSNPCPSRHKEHTNTGLMALHIITKCSHQMHQ